MPNYTPNYNLKKPLGTEKYDIQDNNGNMDKIDTQMANNLNEAKNYTDSEISSLSSSMGNASLIDTTGDGSKFLANDGSYKQVDLTEYLTKTTYDADNDGIIDKADKANSATILTGLTKTVAELNTSVDKSNVIITTGDGKSVLANDGSYKPVLSGLTSDNLSEGSLHKFVTNALETKIDDDIKNLATINSAEDGNVPIITFIDDDGTDFSFSRTYPIFKSKNIPATFALITDKVDTAGYLTLDQVRQLQSEGFSIASHSKTHSDSIFNTNLASTLDSAIESEFLDSQLWFENNGLGKCDTIVYPHANFDSHAGAGQAVRVKALARKYYDYGVNADGWFNTSPNDNMYIKRYFPDYDIGDTFAKIQQVIDWAISQNAWLIIGVHAFKTTQFPSDQIALVIDYLQSKGVSILNFKDAIEIKKNRLSLGEYTDKTKGFFVGRDGNVVNNSENCKIIKGGGITTDSPISTFAVNKFSMTNIDATGDLINHIGGTLWVYNGGDYYGNEIFIGNYGQKMYMRAWDTTNSIWNPWVQITHMPTAVSNNSYTTILNSPITYFATDKMTHVYIKLADDNFKNAGGMYKVYHGATGCSYSTFEPITENAVYKRTWNDSTTSWNSWI